MKYLLQKTFGQVKKILVAIVGFTVLGIGIALIVLPGPAFLIIPTGLAILAVEFAWARRLLTRMKEKLRRKQKNQAA